jgi:hypothetical protein
MRKVILLALFLISSSAIRAQFVIEALAGNKEAHYINYFDKNLDSTGKWNYFNLNRFTIDYKNKALNTVSIEGQLTYQVTPWLGISVGGGFYGELFVPTIGLSLSYLNNKEDFFIQMYPTIGIAGEQFAPSVLGLLGYTPKINKNWGLSSQIIFSVDEIEAFQIVRIGASYKNKFQFGIGIDMTQTFGTKLLQVNLGPFVRCNF